MTQINATEMQQGDIISFNGAEFILGEVKNSGVGTDKEVYWAIGVCNNPTKSMLNDSYFYNFKTKQCEWQFQGNAKRKLIKVN
jgi:hypothetical protein